MFIYWLRADGLCDINICHLARTLKSWIFPFANSDFALRFVLFGVVALMDCKLELIFEI